MYLPNGFEKGKAIELGNLILAAYEQLAFFEDEMPWGLSNDYKLVTELKYPLGKTGNVNGINFDIDVKRQLTIKKKNNAEMPIGFIARRANDVFIVFRGTKTAKEWIKNFNMGLTDYLVSDYGEVHDGFLQTYSFARDSIIEGLKVLEEKTRVFVTGHSLGAALATLAAPDIENNMVRKINGIYTFGSPRVGNAKFSISYNKEFGKKSFRIANSSDLVTSIPLPVPLIGFVGGYFSHIDNQVCFNVQEDDSEKNHAMKTYISEIMNAENRNGILQKIFCR